MRVEYVDMLLSRARSCNGGFIEVRRMYHCNVLVKTDGSLTDGVLLFKQMVGGGEMQNSSEMVLYCATIRTG